MELFKKRIAKLERELIPDNTNFILEIKPDPIDPAKWYKIEDGNKVQLFRSPVITGTPEIKVQLK